MRVIPVEPNEHSITCRHCRTTLFYLKEEEEIEYTEWDCYDEGNSIEHERRLKKYYLNCPICGEKIYGVSVPQIRRKGSKLYEI